MEAIRAIKSGEKVIQYGLHRCLVVSCQLSVVRGRWSSVVGRLLTTDNEVLEGAQSYVCSSTSIGGGRHRYSDNKPGSRVDAAGSSREGGKRAGEQSARRH